MHHPCFPGSRKPVCLPPNALDVAAGASLVVTGWGYLKENGEKPNSFLIIINFHLMGPKKITHMLLFCLQVKSPLHFRWPKSL